MPRPNCPHGRGALYSAPGPLFGRTERRQGEPAPIPVTPEATVTLPTRRIDISDLPMHRHVNPIPAPTTPAINEALCLLRQENELLTEILASINALTAATLARKR